MTAVGAVIGRALVGALIGLVSLLAVSESPVGAKRREYARISETEIAKSMVAKTIKILDSTVIINTPRSCLNVFDFIRSKRTLKPGNLRHNPAGTEGGWKRQLQWGDDQRRFVGRFYDCQVTPTNDIFCWCVAGIANIKHYARFVCPRRLRWIKEAAFVQTGIPRINICSQLDRGIFLLPFNDIFCNLCILTERIGHYFHCLSGAGRLGNRVLHIFRLNTSEVLEPARSNMKT